MSRGPARRAVILGAAASLAALAAGCGAAPPGGDAAGAGEGGGGAGRAVARGARRDITLALWAGADEESARGPLPRIETTLAGPGGERVIRGPAPWKDARSGRVLHVYERIARRRKGGAKRQLFAPTHGGQALGRVLDERTGLPVRLFDDDAIFPLGPWREGEAREFAAVEHTVLGPAARTQTLEIRRIDLEFAGVPGSLEYDWSARDAAGRLLYAERYVYSPGLGQVRFVNLLGSA